MSAVLPGQGESALQAIHHRRSVRKYTTERPPDTTLQELLDAAVHAPTAMHLEPWAFVLIQDQGLLKRYSDRAKAMLLEQIREPRHGTQSAAAEYRHMLADPSFSVFYDAGTLIVVCRKPLGPYAEADCWLAAENLMLAAYAKGLGTCCIGFAIGLLNTPEVKKELGIADDVAAVAPIIVGYPAGVVPAVSRKPPELLRWIR